MTATQAVLRERPEKKKDIFAQFNPFPVTPGLQKETENVEKYEKEKYSEA